MNKGGKMSTKILKIINLLLLIILIPVLLLATILIIKSYIYKEEVPSLFGYSPLIVLSGSMESEIYTGDLIIVKKEEIDKLQKNDIIAFFTDTDKRTIITHRIVDIKQNINGKYEFTTKGDNNNTEDKEVVKEELVVGKYQNIRIKGLGNVAMFLQTPTGTIVAISIPVFIIIIIQYYQNIKDRKELEQLRKEKNTKN